MLAAAALIAAHLLWRAGIVLTSAKFGPVGLLRTAFLAKTLTGGPDAGRWRRGGAVQPKPQPPRWPSLGAAQKLALTG